MPKFSKPTITWTRETGVLHVEADGCVVNIRQGIRCNGNGATATVVEVLADADRYPSDNPWWIEDQRDNTHHVTRVVQRDRPGDEPTPKQQPSRIKSIHAMTKGG